MGLLSFTPGKRVDAFGRELAADFGRRCPLPDPARGARLSEKKIEQALAETYQRAKAFRQENRLGFINRARLARSFQDELGRLGYPAPLVSQVTSSLLTSALTGD